jgi:hypothetical protein
VKLCTVLTPKDLRVSDQSVRIPEAAGFREGPAVSG